MPNVLKTLALAATVCVATALPAAANYGSNSDEAVIFKHPEFRGSALALDGPVYNLRKLGFNDTVSSIDVNGVWEVCVDPDFRGRCVVINGPTAHLTQLRMNDNISSMRPLNGTPRRISGQRNRDINHGRQGRGNHQAHNQGIQGRNTVFFPRPRDAYGEGIPVGRGNASQFCRDMGLNQAVYADRGRGNLTDILCAK